MKKTLLISFSVLLIIELVFAFTPSSLESHQNTRLIHAPKNEVWKVVSDVSNYYQYATGLTSTSVISGKGVGMIRSCSDESATWQETCTAWDEGDSYSFNVDVNSGFPYPFKAFNGTWTVDGQGHDASTITISFNYQFPYRWMSWFYNDDTHQLIDEGNASLLDNWEKAIEKKVAIQSALD